MRTTSTHHPHGHAKGRTHPLPILRRIAASALAIALIAVWVCVPTAVSAADLIADGLAGSVASGIASSVASSVASGIASGVASGVTDTVCESVHEAGSEAVSEAGSEAGSSNGIDEADREAPSHSTSASIYENTRETSEEIGPRVLPSSSARGAEAMESSVPVVENPPMELPAKTGYRPLYPYPAGAMAVTLYKDGVQVLTGHAADIGGTVYVPVQRFADLFGSFRTVYAEATEEVVITGENLSVAVRVGDAYITVNDRIFYTSAKVISLGGWIFVPLTAMCKALGARVTIRQGYYDAFITSGDPTGVARAAEVYDSTDVYWLSRIISAEAKGESLEGQIAVGNVVLNRVRSSQFPNTVKEVIFDQKYGTQFAPVDNGTIYQTPTASAVRAAKICLEGYSLSTRMLYFFNPRLSATNWISRTRPYIMTIGNHRFYG